MKWNQVKTCVTQQKLRAAKAPSNQGKETVFEDYLRECFPLIRHQTQHDQKSALIYSHLQSSTHAKFNQTFQQKSSQPPPISSTYL